MNVTLAKTAGFCFGVNRAVNTVYDLLQKGERVCTLGPIIHNPQLVDELSQKGVRIVNSPDEAKSGETLVIRSHGVEKSVIDYCTQNGIKFVDATCTFVSKIHRIVYEKSRDGYVVIIAGDINHQEVKGIVGHSVGDTFVVQDDLELEDLLRKNGNFAEKNIILVSQTTFNKKVWQKIEKNLKKVCTNAEIFDTICNATAMRQQEAFELSKLNDAVVVIGGKGSSNTAKLFDVCKANCSNTYWVETADELNISDFSNYENVAVVAGASTPAGIIKEVLKTMSENLQPVEQLEEVEVAPKSFEEMTAEEAFEASLNSLTGDQKVTGVVIAVNPSEITVDIGRGVTGYVTAGEYSSDPNVNLVDEVKVDDKLNLIIMKISDQEGTAMLSKRRYDAIAGWDNIKAAKDSGEILKGVVREIIKRLRALSGTAWAILLWCLMTESLKICSLKTQILPKKG